jgi:hypothetical protein
MEITNDRLKHLNEVAKRMRDYVAQHSEKFDCLPEDMYILGLIHDVGYAFVDRQEDHASAAGEVLKTQGYKYWKEVYYHGIPQNEYDSIELRLLNYIDITTGPSGDIVSVDERIEDIKERYGEDSYQATEAIKMAEIIRQKPL